MSDKTFEPVFQIPYFWKFKSASSVEHRRLSILIYKKQTTEFYSKFDLVFIASIFTVNFMVNNLLSAMANTILASSTPLPKFQAVSSAR